PICSFAMMPKKPRSTANRAETGLQSRAGLGWHRRILIKAESRGNARGKWGRRVEVRLLAAAGERKWFAMRIFTRILMAAVIAAAGAGAASAGGVKYASPQMAFEQGLGAYKSGYYEIAIPALEEAAASGAELNKFFAEFYLARIYSDNASAVTDHAKAYLLFQKLADENADVDPDDGQRAPFVANALSALAGYLRRGVREIGMKPDPARARAYLHP